MAFAMLALLWLPVLGLRERPEFQGRQMASPFRATRDVVTNPHARRLLAIWFIAQLGMSSQGVIAPYMATYVMKRSDLMGVIPALFIGPLILSVPLWITLARRFGRKRVWLVSMRGASISYALLFLLPPNDFVVTGFLLETRELYFVAVPGGSGHAFSETLQQHNRAVARWRTYVRSAR